MNKHITVARKYFGSAHTADLDAHTKHLFEIMRTGQYQYTRGTATTSTYQLSANRLYAVFFLAPRDITIDRLGIYTTTGVGGKVARIGIYNNGTNMYPGTLLRDFGEVDVAGSAEIDYVAYEQELTKGIYWMALVSDGTSTVRGIAIGAPSIGMSVTFTEQDFWYVGHSYGALPDPFTASATAAGDGPVALPRLLSLD